MTKTEHERQDQEAQSRPEGNVPDRTDTPEIGVPVDNGEPSGEQNGEEDLDG